MGERQNRAKIAIKNRKRLFVVLLVLFITILVAYVIFRGSYLEMLEIGENYVSVYWQNIRYMSLALVINFILIYTI